MIRRLLLALGFFAIALTPSAFSQPTPVGPANAILCNQIANMAPGPTSQTQVIAPVTGKVLVFCGWHITNTGTTGTFSITVGTGSNCGTNNAVVITTQNVTSTAPSADHIDYATYSTPISYAMCVTPSVATIAATLYFAQF